MPPCSRCKLYCRDSLLDGEAARRQREQDEQLHRELALAHGGWCGHINARVPPSTAKKVQEFVQRRPAILHSDELIDKKDARHVEFLLQMIMVHGTSVQVVFLQGAVPLQMPRLFSALCELLRTCPIWSVNLGELRFSAEQLELLAATLRESGVTHMFYECTVAGQYKDTFRSIIRRNREKHGRWRLSADCKQNLIVLSAVKNWFCPTSHACNKRWAHRNREGWHGVERVQCEACLKWRRLPEGNTSWKREFYCQYNYWDRRFSSCSAAEEEWTRPLPVAGDRVLCLVGERRWRQGVVRRMPTEVQWMRHKSGGDDDAGGHASGPPPASADGRSTGPLSAASPPSDTPDAHREKRVRKPLDLFKAESCTAHSRDLRESTKEEEERRKSFRVVEFASAPAELCLQLLDGGRGMTWLFAHEWLGSRPEGHQLDSESAGSCAGAAPSDAAAGHASPPHDDALLPAAALPPAQAPAYGHAAQAPAAAGDAASSRPRKNDAAPREWGCEKRPSQSDGLRKSSRGPRGERVRSSTQARQYSQAVPGVGPDACDGVADSVDGRATQLFVVAGQAEGAAEVGGGAEAAAAAELHEEESLEDVARTEEEARASAMQAPMAPSTEAGPVQVSPGDAIQFKFDGAWWCPAEVVRHPHHKEWARVREWIDRAKAAENGNGRGSSDAGRSGVAGPQKPSSPTVPEEGAPVGARPRRDAPVVRYDTTESSAELSRRKREEARRDDELRRRYWWVEIRSSPQADAGRLTGRKLVVELAAETVGELWAPAKLPQRRLSPGTLVAAKDCQREKKERK